MSQIVKIAVATEDGTHVSAHFGQAPFFEVFSIEQGQIVARERRDKSFHQGPHDHHHHAEGGVDSHAAGMLAAVRDCSTVVAGGMGRPAYSAIQAAGLVPIVTDVTEIDQVALAFAKGTLTNHVERLH